MQINQNPSRERPAGAARRAASFWRGRPSRSWRPKSASAGGRKRKPGPKGRRRLFAETYRRRRPSISATRKSATPRARPSSFSTAGPTTFHAFAEVAPILAAAGYRVIVPYLRGYGATQFLSRDTPRNGQPAALASDVIALMDALGVDAAILAGFDWGARTACIVAALYPQRCRALVSVSGYLIANQETGKAPLPPQAELSWWYQFYFATPRGQAGYEAYRRDFARLIWRTASPQWRFDEETFARSASALDNLDHVARRHPQLSMAAWACRWGASVRRARSASGSRAHSSPHRRITLEGDANGAPHPEPASYSGKFAGRYEHRLIRGGVGHNLPQEAPRDFAQAVLDLGGA